MSLLVRSRVSSENFRCERTSAEYRERLATVSTGFLERLVAATQRGAALRAKGNHVHSRTSMRRTSLALGVLVMASLATVRCEPEEREFRLPRSAPTTTSSGGQSSAVDTADSGVEIEDVDVAAVARGRAQFARLCTPCHGVHGQGVIGPNLTDGVSINEAENIDLVRTTIADGVASRGMPAWEPSVGAQVVGDLTAFVWSLRHTNVSGRAAQGSFPLPSP